MIAFLAAAILAYLIGSFPSGFIAGRICGVDLRVAGSGNVGATNALRVLGKKWGYAVFAADAFKGALAVLSGLAIAQIPAIQGPTPAHVGVISALFAIIGHSFPVWLGFKGGKGVATFYGTLIAVAWPLGLAAGATWLAVAYFLRISSLAALTSAALAPLLALLVFDQPYPVTALALFMAILIFVRHQENIRRLVKGEEPKIGAKKPAPEAGQ